MTRMILVYIQSRYYYAYVLPVVNYRTVCSAAMFRLPKVIHQTVRDKGQLSCQQRKGIVSWKALNPGYSHRLWDDADIQRFMEQHYPDLVPLPFNDFLAGAERSDLWRMLVLHKVTPRSSRPVSVMQHC